MIYRGKKDVLVAGVYQHMPDGYMYGKKQKQNLIALLMCCLVLRLRRQKGCWLHHYRSYHGAPVACLQVAPLAIRPDDLFGILRSAQPPVFALGVCFCNHTSISFFDNPREARLLFVARAEYTFNQCGQAFFRVLSTRASVCGAATSPFLFRDAKKRPRASIL